MDLAACLIGCSDSNEAVRKNAEASLRQASESNFAEFSTMLSLELADEGKPDFVRQLAGLMLKNEIKAKSVRWKELSIPVKSQIKSSVLTTLQTSKVLPQRAAAQVIATITIHEFPNNEWSELLPSLLNLAAASQINLRLGTQIVAGYIAEDFSTQDLDILNDEQCNSLLTLTVQGMRDSEIDVRINACTAFYFAVLFAADILQRPDERNVIFEVVCNNCKSTNCALQNSAFEIIVQLATEYYNILPDYMNVIGPMTWEAIKHAPEPIAITALEFWNTICDNETNNPDQNQNFIHKAMPFLLPIIFDSLCKQKDQEPDPDDWTVSMAAGLCLSLLAQVLQNLIIEPTICFLDANFYSPEWNRREAALMAYGSIMEGPDSKMLAPMVAKSFGKLCRTLEDPVVVVRDTAAWAVGRIASNHPDVLEPLLEQNTDGIDSKLFWNLLISKLMDAPQVSANICWTIDEIVQNPKVSAHMLNNRFADLCKALIEVSERPDAGQRQLREAACNALSSAILNVGEGSVELMGAIVNHETNQLKEALGAELSDEKVLELSTRCICLSALLNRVHNIDYKPIYEVLVSFMGKAPNGYLPEESLLAMSALLNHIPENELNAIMSNNNNEKSLLNLLIRGLKNSEFVPPCKLCALMVGDIARKLKSKFVSYAGVLIPLFYEILHNPTAEQNIKPNIMLTVGDIALAIQGEFEPYLNPFMDLLGTAASVTPTDGPVDDEAWIAYIIELRDSILQAYSGIVIGIKEDNKLHILKIHVNRMLELVQLIVATPSQHMGAQNIDHCITLTGDLLEAYGSELMQHLKDVPFIRLLGAKAEEGHVDEERLSKLRWLETVILRHHS